MNVERLKDIVTDRVALIAITPESVRSEQAGDGLLGEIAASTVPAEWPPEHWEPHVFDFVLTRFAADASDLGWHRYIALLTRGERILIWTLGGFRRPERPGACEVGYSVLPKFRGHGYATEGLRAFLAWTLADPAIQTVVAQTFPTFPASIRVMERCGMTFAGDGYEEGAVL